MRASTDPRRAILFGALAGIGAGLVFATAHAMLIVPIWDRMARGLAFGALAGAIGGWTFTELYGEYASETLARRASAGARFGALLWLAVAPVSLVDAVVRATGVRLEALGVIIALTIAIATGAVFGRMRARTTRGMIAGAAATVALAVAMAGPVPIGQSARAFGIFLAVLPASLIGGVIVGSLSGLRTVRPSKASVVEG